MLNHELDMDAFPSLAARSCTVAVPAGTTEATSYPSIVPHSPTAIVLPAMGVPARRYARLARVLGFHGINAVVVDLRGTGSSSLRAARHVDWGYLDLVDHEVEAAVVLARGCFPGTPRFFVGHSLGGQLALLHLARHAAADVAGAVLVASGSPYAGAYRGAMRLVLPALAAMIRFWSTREGVWRGDRFRFGGLQPRTLMSEFARFIRSGELRLEGAPAWNVEAALRGIRAPVVALTVRGDRYAPPGSVRHLHAKLRSIVWQEEMHGAGPAPGHFGWLRDPEATACAIAANLPRLGISRSPV